MAYFRFAGTEKESAIAKKLQKRRDFCFCNEKIARQGKAEYTFAYSEISPRRRESFAPGNATKKPPEGGFILRNMAGPAGFEPT